MTLKHSRTFATDKNVSLPTVRQFGNVYSPFPLKVTWDITHKCNLRCQHCFVIFQENAEPVASEHERHMAIAQSIASAHPFIVSIAGGEPFLVDHLAEISNYFVEQGARVVIATNGTINNPQTIESLRKSRRVSLQVSIDGASAADHDTIRGIGSFEKTINFLKNYSSLIPVIVAVTLTDRVCQTLGSVIELIQSCGVSTVKLQNFVIAPTVPNKSIGPTHASLLSAKMVLENSQVFRNMTIFTPFDENDHSCGVGLRECTITPSGNLALCGAVLDHCGTEGNVTRVPLADLWKTFISRRPSVGEKPGMCLCNQ